MNIILVTESTCCCPPPAQDYFIIIFVLGDKHVFFFHQYYMFSFILFGATETFSLYISFLQKRILCFLSLIWRKQNPPIYFFFHTFWHAEFLPTMFFFVCFPGDGTFWSGARDKQKTTYTRSYYTNCSKVFSPGMKQNIVMSTKQSYINNYMFTLTLVFFKLGRFCRVWVWEIINLMCSLAILTFVMIYVFNSEYPGNIIYRSYR